MGVSVHTASTSQVVLDLARVAHSSSGNSEGIIQRGASIRGNTVNCCCVTIHKLNTLQKPSLYVKELTSHEVLNSRSSF